MKKLLCYVLAVMLVVGMTACTNRGSGVGGATNPKATSPSSPSVEETSEATEPSSTEVTETQGIPEETSVLSVSDLSLYGNIQDTNLVSVVLYAGSPNKAGIEGKAVIATYDIGDTLYNTEMLSDKFTTTVNANNFLYHFGLSSSKGVFTALTNNGYVEDGLVYYGVFSEFDDNGLYKFESRNNAVLMSLKKGATLSDTLVTDGWYSSTYEEVANNMYVKIGETEDENIYAHMLFNNPITVDDNFENAVNEALKNGDFKYTVTVLNDINDLSSVEATYGPEVDLSKTVFLQDILATKLANMYGLTLKDRETRINWDTTYIEYKGNDAKVTFDYFEGASAYVGKGLSYSVLDTITDEKGKFSYTDSEGNKYSYFAGNCCIYICKNEELIGVAKTSSDNAYAELSQLFGIK